MVSRLLLGLLAVVALCACGGNLAEKQALAKHAALLVPAPVALAAHADADHALVAGGIQDLDKTTERFISALEALPEPLRNETASLVSRPKLLEWFGFDPTKRAGWDDIGVDAAAGAFVVLDDRWPKSDGAPRQVVVFVRLSNFEHWQALLTRKGAIFGKDGPADQNATVQTCEIDKMTFWLTRSGDDYAMTLGNVDSPEAKTLAMKAFLAIAKTPAAPLDRAPSWKLAVRDSGRPWMAAWARTGDLYANNPDFGDDIGHFTKLFPQFAWWLGEGWALRVMTAPAAHEGLKEMFVPEKAAPACAGLIAAEGWGAMRVSIHLNTFADGLLRLMPPSTPPEQRAVMAASVTSVLAMTGLPPGDVMAAWSGHLCAAIDMSSLPGLLSGETLPNWLLVLGVQDGLRADAALAALVDRAKNQMSATVRTVTISGQPGYSVQLGPLGIAAVRDGERIVFGPSPEAVTTALARPVGQSLAGTPMADALDGRGIFGVIVDLRTARDIALSVMQARQFAEENAKSLSDAFAAVLGNTRLAGMAMRLDDGSVMFGPAGVAEPGWSGATMIGVLAAIAIPQFVKYRMLAKVSEARANLKVIRQAAMVFWETQRLDAKPGTAPRFPQTTVITPATSCCDPAVDRDGDQRCDADPTPWQQVGWQELGFQPGGQHSFRYRFESSGTGDSASFTASAYGDLDCDGVQSTFQISARPCKGKNCKDKFKFDESESAPNE